MSCAGEANQRLLARAATHESGHCVAALHFALPLREVFIRDDGTGGTRYARRLSSAELSSWTVTAFAGPEAEIAVYGDADERGDLLVIERMLRRRRLDWPHGVLARYRRRATVLVERERVAIAIVAEALLQHRRLDGRQIAAMLYI